jgi:hypothetical protein
MKEASPSAVVELDTTLENAFVLEIAGRPVLAMKTPSLQQAERRCAEAWFLEEIEAFRSGGAPIWDGRATLTVRPARPSELAALWETEAADVARNERDSHVFAFLIPIDAPLQ